jgi:RNA polymerase II-associated factor 1
LRERRGEGPQLGFGVRVAGAKAVSCAAMSSHKPPSGSSSHAQRRPESSRSKQEAIKIELTEGHSPLMRIADQTYSGIKNRFICKMKIRNECPPLPFEPKFLAYPSEANRLTRYSCTNLEKSHKHALLTEPDLGIHIDLIEPETYEPPADGIEMQPEDAVLLEDEVKKRKMRPGLEGDRGKRANVPWLHKTAYYGNEDLFQMQMGFKSQQGEMQEDEDDDAELSHKQVAERLEKTFTAPSTLAALKHPTKPALTAVKVWDILPDWNTWPNDYTEIVFDHDPTACDVTVAKQMRSEKTKEAAAEGDRKRKILGSTAFMHIRKGEARVRRSMSVTQLEEPSKIFGFYLPAPDTKRRQRAEEHDDAGAEGDDELDATEFHCVREHVENEARKYAEPWDDDHFVFAFVDGENGEGGRALYHPLKARTYLRKCKNVITFESIDTLSSEELRALQKRGNRFPKYFKGLQRVSARASLTTQGGLSKHCTLPTWLWCGAHAKHARV